MIIVCSLKDLNVVCESIKPSHLISVIDPGHEPQTPNGVLNHLKLGFDDIDEVSENNSIFRLNTDKFPQLPPNEDHTNSIIDFTKDWDSRKPIVIHCWCGVSRSMATAIYILCKINPENVDTNVRYMRSIAPHANPNKLMVSIFERYLKIDGQIIKAFNKYPHTTTYDCATTFAPVTIFKIKELKDFR